MAVEGGLELVGAPDVLAFNGGRVLLLGRLAGGGVNSGNNQAVMSYDPSVDANTCRVC